jgi:Leucine-rich repeat (LRR) protein
MLPQSLGRELIPHLANYPKLKHFHPMPHYLTDEDMKVIGTLRQLEFLDLQTNKLTLEGYKHLANLTEAKSVQLPPQIPPGAIGYLSKMKLEYVYFPESTTIDELRLFQGMSTLRYVRVPKSVTDDGLQLIAGFKSVENVGLTEAELVTPAGMAYLANMKSLRSVTIPYSMGDEGLLKLASCQSLVELSLDDNSRITSSGMKMLQSLPKLERLRLPRTCDDQGLEAVAECRNLKGLSIRESAVTAKGFKKIQELKKLEELNLSSLKLTQEQLGILKSMTNLKSLTLVQCTLPSGDGGELKNALPKCRVNIH